MLRPLPLGLFVTLLAAIPVSALDQMPKPISTPPPKYPTELRIARVEGFALVDFIIDTRGLPRFAFPAVETNAEFGASAVAAVAQWRFSPGLKSGKPVNVHMVAPLMFNLGSVALTPSAVAPLQTYCSRVSVRWGKLHAKMLARGQMYRRLVGPLPVSFGDDGKIRLPATDLMTADQKVAWLCLAQTAESDPVPPDVVDYCRSHGDLLFTFPFP